MKFIILCFIIILFIIYSYNKYKNKIYVNRKKLTKVFNLDNQNNIFMYWETLPGKKKPEYLDLCYDTVIKNCSNDFEILMLNEKNIKYYLPNLRDDLDKKLKIQQKVDYYRLLLLYNYGGIWLDSDTIVIKSLKILFNKLKTYNYIGFGCHKSGCQNTGKPFPANWVMMCKKNEVLMKKCINKADYYLDNSKHLFNSYFKLGRNLLNNEIKSLLINDKNWDYYHHSSICTERDSRDKKIYNSRMISKENIDPKCLDIIYFIPIYNTAPGFPDWFINMKKNKILSSDMLISKYFRLALK